MFAQTSWGLIPARLIHSHAAILDNTQNAAAVWEQMLHTDTCYVNHSQAWSVKICLCECAHEVHVNEKHWEHSRMLFLSGGTLLSSPGFSWLFNHILHFLHMMSKTKPELFLNRAPFLWVLSLIGWVNIHKRPLKVGTCTWLLLCLPIIPEVGGALSWTTWTLHIQLQQGNCAVLHQNKSFIYSS